MTNRNDSRKDRRPRGEIEDRLVAVNRITKVAKGDRRMRFAAFVIAGDKKGHVGFGASKAQEVPKAIRKAVEAGKKNMISVSTVGTTIPHEVIGHSGSGNILLKPAEAGSGAVAGGAVRTVMDMAGIADIISKSLGSNIPINVVRVAIDGLKKLKTHEDVSELRESAKSSQD